MDWCGKARYEQPGNPWKSGCNTRVRINGVLRSRSMSVADSGVMYSGE